MKKCPYCAEMIQDEAIKCRYCHSDLTVVPPTVSAPVAAVASEPVTSEPATNEPTDPTPEDPPSPSPTATTPEPEAAAEPEATPDEPAVAAAAVAPAAAVTTSPPAETSNVRYTHSGYRYVLGYGEDFFGIWDRQSPSVAAERFPRTDDGWRQAWLRFAALEPDHTTVPADGSAPMVVAPQAQAQTQTPSPGAATMDPGDTAAVQYTHSGSRYLLGYGKTFFGIWDRQSPAMPLERFARDDAGWAAAWGRYTQMEPNFAEVKLG